MRQKTVKIGGRIVTVKEMTVGGIKGLFAKYSADYGEFVAKIKEERQEMLASLQEGDPIPPVDTFGPLSEFVKSKVVELFPELDGVSMDDLYPSEIEALAEAFMDVNFTGARKLTETIFKFADRANQFAPIMPGPGK